MLADNNTIDQFLTTLINQVPPTYVYEKALFQVLYNTGLRAQESIQLNRWSLYDTSNYLVTTSKSSHNRIISRALVPEPIQNQIILQTLKFKVITYDTLLNYFEKMSKGIIFSVGGKKTALHLFRYNYARKLQAGGKTVEEIRHSLGHVSIENTNIYLDSPVEINY